ncbi:MAG: thermonuclease family protein [Syntrophobacteraceae bacterium]|jgi:endonuclease YncB( thermonuclease family)
MPQKIGSASFFVLVFAFIILFHSHCSAWQGKVVGVQDSDLLLISHGTQTDRVKLYGIESPRKGQPYWQQSQVLASHLALQKIVEVTPLYVGSDGLENALVRIEGVKDYLNLQIITYGLAWVKPKECSAHICAEWRAMESLAQSKAIGLWIDPNPIPPWQWEKEQRHKIQERRQSQERTSE